MSIMNYSEKCQGTWTWASRGSRSVIDYILASQQIDNLISSMKIDDTAELWSFGTDHSIIETTINVSYKSNERIHLQKQWNINNSVDWKSFSRKVDELLFECKSEIPTNINEEATNLLYKKITDSISNAASEFIGYCSKSQRKHCLPKVIRRAIKRRNKTGSRWRKSCINKSHDITRRWNEFLMESKIVDKLMTRDKLKNKKKWIQRIINEGGVSSRSLWTSLKDARSTTGALLHNGAIISDGSRALTIVKSFFESLGNDPNKNEKIPNLYIVQSIYKDSINHKKALDHTETSGYLKSMLRINVNETIEAIKKLGNNKSRGPDNIPNEMIKNAGQNFPILLTVLFNASHELNWIPNEWSIEAVQLIHKKGNTLALDNYRPIAITSNIGKIYTRILAKRLSEESESKGLMPEAQAGCRPGRGVSVNLFILSSIIDQSKVEKSPFILAFIDVRKAFDSVNREILWFILEKLQINEDLISRIRSTYNTTNRKIMWSGNYTDCFKYDRGLLQGCPMSSTLFQLYTAHIPKYLDKMSNGITIGHAKITCLAYADDIVLISETRSDMINQLSSINCALNELKLDINFKKSKIIRLGPGSHMKSLWRMENQNQEETRIIEEADHYKYLGVTFGKGKPYVKHMNEVKHQIPFKVACLKAKSSQATDKQIAAVALWNNVVLPTLTYGAEVITFNPDTINRIDSAQNGIGKWILGTSKTSNPQAVKGLLNMGSIKMLLSTKLLSMWSSILAMGSERWPKMIMDHMRSSNKKFTWYSSVLKALGKYHLSMDFYPSIKAKKQITSLCSVFYWNQWQSSHKPYFNLLLKPDLHESTDKQLAIYYRITTNDKWSITGSYSYVCPLCS